MREKLLGFLLFLIILFGCGKDNTNNSLTGPVSAPQITGVTPNTANPGQQNIEGRIHGSNLNGVMSVDMGEGVRVERFSALSGSEVYVVFSVAREAAPGARKVTLTTSGGVALSTNSFSVGDNRNPIALFTVSPPSGFKATEFLFDGSKSSDPDGSIVAYHWEFGDRSSSSAKVVRHQFRTGGNFEVTLSVTDNRSGTDRLSKTMDVARSRSPIARFSVTPETGDTSTLFRFDGSASHDPDGRVQRYTWQFGDGSTAEGVTAEHRYATGNSFPVILAVSDNTGVVGQTDRQVVVRPSDQPPPSDGPPPDDGGGPPPSGSGQQCTKPASNRGLIYGTVIAVEGNNAIVRLDPGATCSNSYYHCGDMRRASPEEFRGIIHRMSDLGNGVFSVFNDCPFRWPPAIGEQVFLYWKSCSQNFCP
jgi:hypothetical protein